MPVSGRQHSADDIIATVLAVEPMKFIYRGKFLQIFWFLKLEFLKNRKNICKMIFGVEFLFFSNLIFLFCRCCCF